MIARVFPSRTAQTPVDEYAFVGDPPLFLPPDITEVHVSVTFSWDLPEARRLSVCNALARPERTVRKEGSRMGETSTCLAPACDDLYKTSPERRFNAENL